MPLSSSPSLSPVSPTSPTSPLNVDDASSASPPSSSASPLRRRIFALSGLFQKVAASPLSPRRSSSQAALKHVASESWDNDAEDLEELAVSSSSPEFALADVAFASSLPPVSSPPEWHHLPAHILELIVESSLLPENELTTPWKERAVRFFFEFCIC